MRSTVFGRLKIRNFLSLGQTSRRWSGMTTLGNNVYAAVFNGDIYMQTNN